jgi:hypothetical protein
MVMFSSLQLPVTVILPEPEILAKKRSHSMAPPMTFPEPDFDSNDQGVVSGENVYIIVEVFIKGDYRSIPLSGMKMLLK